MARVDSEHIESVVEDIVYDSQEEQDQWPDSQPRDQEVSRAEAKTVTTHRPTTYSSQRKVTSP